MPKLTPILCFKGKAAQAIATYQKAFGAEIKFTMPFSKANPNDLQYAEEEKDYIYHARITIGEQLIYIADDSDGILTGESSTNSYNSYAVDFVVEFDTDDELKTAFDILSDGAEITKPMHSPAYCSLCVYLTDKFGARWQFISNEKK